MYNMNMKTLPTLALTEKQQCVLQEMINRRGVIVTADVASIAMACDITKTQATDLVNGSTPAGKRVNELVNEAVGWQPILDKGRRAAYAQVILEDKLYRRQEMELPLSDMDAIQILDYVRKEANETGSMNINVQNVENIFDFSGMDIQDLQSMIQNIQQQIDTGEIVDAKFTELAAPDESEGGSGEAIRSIDSSKVLESAER
jgi:hypothetical protein